MFHKLVINESLNSLSFLEEINVPIKLFAISFPKGLIVSKFPTHSRSKMR